jgi:hypothetical protein
VALCGRYLKIKPNSPRAYELGILSTQGEKRIVDNLAYFCEVTNSSMAPDIVAQTAANKWLKRDGNGGFLVRVNHPLEQFAKDAADIVGLMILDVENAQRDARNSARAEAEREARQARREKPIVEASRAPATTAYVPRAMHAPARRPNFDAAA